MIMAGLHMTASDQCILTRSHKSCYTLQRFTLNLRTYLPS